MEKLPHPIWTVRDYQCVRAHFTNFYKKIFYGSDTEMGLILSKYRGETLESKPSLLAWPSNRIEMNHKSLSHNAEYKNKFTDDFFLLLAWMSVFSSGQPHCKTCHSSDGNENNFRSAVQANSQSQYLHRIEVSRIFPSNLRKTNRFFTKDNSL